MTMQWVRDNYGVPAIRGGIVQYDGVLFRITSADHRLRARQITGSPVLNRPAILHPTSGVEYLRCHEETEDRDGWLGPCDRPAVGFHADPRWPESSWPVCRRHERGPS